MIGKLKNIVFGITFLTTLSVFGQTAPVQVMPQMIPPYSLSLSDYATSFNEKIIVNILLTDVVEQNMQVGIRLYIENRRGINIQSTPVVIGASPIYIDGGVPLKRSNLDLKPYFQLQNLQGISPQQYNQPLPDGMYQFCFEVFEWTSGQSLSKKSCANAYLVLNDPPILNFPDRGETMTEKDPQNLVFQWTPRHLNATNVEYEFTLVELWDDQMDPQAAFLAGRPLYQTTTRANTLLYGPSEVALLPDKRYAWRVRAIVNDGVSEAALFRNEGYSEIFDFTYFGNCDAPQFLLTESAGITSQKIMWQGFDHLKYNILYRKKNSGNLEWFSSEAYSEYGNIYNLEPGTIYEFRVGGQCTQNGPFAYSQLNEFTTSVKTAETVGYSCGITPEIVITNKELLPDLKLEQIFTAGDYPVTVKEIKQVSDVYIGAGYISVPYLGDTKIAVTFDRIKINTDFQLIEGIVETAYQVGNWTDPDSMIGVTDEINRLGIDIGVTLNYFDLIVDQIRGGEVASDGLESVLEDIKDQLPLETIKELEEIQDKISVLEEALENAETDEEKQEIQNQIDELNQQYADAIEKVTKKVRGLILKAVKKYYIKNVLEEPYLIEEYVNIFGEACLAPGTKNNTISDLVVSNNIDFEYEGEVLITEIPDEIKNVIEIQEKYHLYFIAKAIATAKDKDEVKMIQTFIDKALDVDVDLLKILKEVEDRGASDDVILDELVLKIDRVLKELIGKYRYDYLSEY